MFARWLDPHIRTSIAIAVLILSIAGLVLADRAPSQVLVTTPTPVSSPWLGSAPQTSATLQGQGARGRVALSQGRLLASGTRSLYMELRIAADQTTPVTRPPVSFVLAIDTSGSMAGQKIIDARRSATAILAEMNPDDLVSVVRFSSDAQVVVPLMPVRHAREQAVAAIDRMYANGNTDIAQAMRTAERVLGPGDLSRPQRIVLVTDGRDTSGAPRDTGANVARLASARGITSSALGIGVDYDAGYLMSVANAGRGNYEYLGESSALARFLSKEVRETGSTVVQDATARIDLPEGWRVRDVWGAVSDRSDGTLRLRFGPLFAGDERRVIVSLDAEAGAPGSWTTVRATYNWVAVGSSSRVEASSPALRIESVSSPADAESSIDSSVMGSVASVTASRLEQESAEAFERGDRQRALDLNRQSAAELDRAAAAAPAAQASRLRAQKRAYDEDAKVYTSKPAGAAPARGIGARENHNTARDMAY